MPRLSLYRPNRTNDYQFFDRTISEMYQIGGVDMYLHKYMGPLTNDNEGDGGTTNILFFAEDNMPNRVWFEWSCTWN